MRRRDKPLDILKKLQIVRSTEEIVYEDEFDNIQKSVKVDTEIMKVNKFTYYIYIF
jgi:hypothetical protein